MLKEFLDVCICLEEAEIHKPLTKKIAHAKKEHNNGRKEKHQDKLKSHHERCHSSGKCHVGKCKNSETCTAYSPYHRTTADLAGL
eukprot:14165091-Ditylum_brightwellii.AAC.1